MSSMFGKINLQKYGIENLMMISEASWSPRILIKHSDGKEFSYDIPRTLIEEIKAANSLDDILENFLWEHIRKHSVLAQRKEKLKIINEIN